MICRNVPLLVLISTAAIILTWPALSPAGQAICIEDPHPFRTASRAESLDMYTVPLGMDLPDMDPEYLIICPRMFADEAVPLAVHRTKLGLASRIYTLEDISLNFSGADLPEKVHNFLSDLHGAYPASFRWLLILGDSEHLMPRQLWHYAYDRGQPFGNYYNSDVYYAGLDSNWDDNGNGLYGEVSLNGKIEGDLDWDLYVGRLPASNEAQAANYVGKLLRYERNPPVGTWMKRFLNWGSLMEPPNLETGVYRYYDYKSNAYKVCREVEANLPSHLMVKDLYDYPQLEGGNYTPYDGRDTLYRGNMLSDLNGGASLLNFVGQARYEAYALNDYGPPTGDGTIYDWNEPLGYQDHAIFTNSDMMPFMYASTCDTAKFFQTGYWEDMSLETWLTSGYGGIIGLISSTGTSARGEEQNKSWGNWYLDEEFWKLFLDRNETRPGRTLYLLKEQYEDRWYSPTFEYKETIAGMIYTYILLGDPYVDVYTDIASRFMLQGAMDGKFYTGTHMARFQVKDRDMHPVPFPSVTLYNQDIFLTVMGDANGWVNVTLDLGASTELNVTLTKHNMVPAFYKYTVLPEIADLSLDPSEVTVEPPTFGHGDRIDLSITLRNDGGEPALEASLHITYLGGNGDPTYTYSTVQVGTLMPKGSFVHRWNWTVRAGQHAFRIIAQTSSEEIDRFNNDLSIPFSSPGPRLLFEQGSGLIRPSAKVRPFQAVNASYVIYNEGTVPGVAWLRVFMGDPGSGGQPLTEVVSIGAVPPRMHRNGTIDFISTNSTGMVYLAMDPDQEYPPDMIDAPFKTLLEVNYPPVIAPIGSVQVLEDSGTTSIRIDDRVEDPDDPKEDLAFDLVKPQNISASIRSSPAGEVHLDISPSSDWNGGTQVEVIVSDGLGPVVLDVNITVVPVNDPPVFMDAIDGIIELSLLEDSLFSTIIRAYDIEGDDLIFSSLDAPFTLDPSSGNLSWFPGNGDVGTSEQIVKVEDGNGGEATVKLRFLVTGVNDPPTLAKVGDITIEVGQRNYIDLVMADEEQGEIWVVTDRPFVRWESGNRLLINGSADHIGRWLVTLEVTDGVNTVYSSFNVTIIENSSSQGGGEGLDEQVIFAGAGIALAAFSLLLLGFLILRRTKADRDVREEKGEADGMFERDTEIREGNREAEEAPSQRMEE